VYHCGAACLVAWRSWILLSGLDDLFIDLVYLFRCRKPFPWPDKERLASLPQRRIAILAPLWHEHAVAGRMLSHNLSARFFGARFALLAPLRILWGNALNCAATL